MRDYLATGFVLRRFNQAETNRILIFFSQERGKIKLMAKGVRKVGSRRAGHLEPFVLTRLHLHKGRTFDIVTTAETQKVYELDMSDLKIISLGYLVLEMVDRTTVEHHKNDQIFDLLQEVFTALAKKPKVALLKGYFVIKLLVALGNQPDLDAPAGKNLFLSHEEGRVTNQKPVGHSAEISVDIIKLWRLMYGHPYDVVERIQVSPESLKQAQGLLDQYFQYHFGLSFRSGSILK